MKKQFISFMGIFSLFFVGKIFVSSTSKQEIPKKQTEADMDSLPANLPPADLQFAGQHVPVENAHIKHRLDRELKANKYWRPMAADLAQKASRYFAIIRPILKKYGVPDDFKYLPLVESGFSNQVSYSGAAGPWQIMPVTGRHYGLEINPQIDERYHIVHATEAACRMLKDSYRSLKDWTLVAASFNKGLGGITTALRNQKAKSYYDLHLNNQAERYVFRILAVKEIMEHPAKYGLRKNVAHFYYSIPTTRVKVSNSIANLVAFAKKQGVSLLTLKTYNPWLKANRFDNPTNKTYYIEIPRDKDILPIETFADLGNTAPITKKNFVETDSAENFIDENILKKNVYQDDDAITKTYSVNEGEDINFVARKFGVKPSRIIEWNNLKTVRITKGTVLKIYLEENVEETTK
jgi:membrane-bound lytic murein transglycosylase D